VITEKMMKEVLEEGWNEMIESRSMALTEVANMAKGIPKLAGPLLVRATSNSLQTSCGYRAERMKPEGDLGIQGSGPSLDEEEHPAEAGLQSGWN
jgi:hypothetical protein